MPNKMSLYFGVSYREDADGWREVDVATSEELVEFVNIGREAGGADVLDALMPSVRSDSRSCLIANALNFGCIVSLLRENSIVKVVCWPSGAWKWTMKFPFNMSLDTVNDIARAYGCLLVAPTEMLLPEHIGNAARAFDQGIAFREFSYGNMENPNEA